ncbi:hypothetical protein Bbelb_276250 [Branchiostoma belcheri]|nr:hypothetical protein Bbelb_276250 [Branchiostoma belcheri]
MKQTSKSPPFSSLHDAGVCAWQPRNPNKETVGKLRGSEVVFEGFGTNGVMVLFISYANVMIRPKTPRKDESNFDINGREDKGTQRDSARRNNGHRGILTPSKSTVCPGDSMWMRCDTSDATELGIRESGSKTVLDPDIKFTFEQEEDGALPFLDTLTTINQDRANTIISDPADRSSEIDQVTEALKKCGYPQWLIRKASEPRQPQSKPQDSQGTGGKNRKTLVVLPYVKGVSEPLRRIFAAHGVSTCFRPHLVGHQQNEIRVVLAERIDLPFP